MKTSSHQTCGTQQIAPDVVVGKGTKIFHFVNLCGCEIGSNCKIGAFVVVQKGARIGDRCKISSHSFLSEGVTLEDEVLLGHAVNFISDRIPQAATEVGCSLLGEDGRECVPALVRRGASIGTAATILGGVTIGEGAVVEAGALVTQDVAAGSVVAGVPARPPASC